MGEIDDDYKQDVESADQMFLDELNDRKKNAIDNYRKNLKKHIDSLVKRYDKKSVVDIRKARKMKPKKIKAEKFKHLEIKHFDFNFSRWERLKMWWSISLFKNSRRFNIAFNLIPSWIMYVYYKIVKTVSFTYRDVSGFVGKKWGEFKDYVVKNSIAFWKWLKETSVMIKIWVSSKILFWRKKKEGDGEKKGDGEDKKPEGESKT